jgi:O-antigen/teichoic acid export membrane protein
MSYDDSNGYSYKMSKSSAIKKLVSNVLTISRLRKETPLFLSFGVSKLVAFAGPFWIAAHAPADAYGMIEFALNAGIWLAMLAGLGLAGSVPLRLLDHEDNSVKKAILVFIVGVAAFFISTALLADRVSGTSIVAICSLITVFSAMQQVVSAYFRSKEWRLITPWAENIALHMVLIASIVAYYLGGDFFSVLEGVLFASCAIVLLLASVTLWGESNGAIGSYKHSVRLGFPMLLNGIIMLAACNSGRLYIGSFLDLDNVGYYSFAFRLSGILFVLYQIVSLRLYKRMYLLSPDRVGLVCFLSGLSYGLVGLFLAFVFSVTGVYITPPGMSFGVLNELMPLVITQTALWILSSMMELRINRAGYSRQSFSAVLCVPIVLVACFYALSNYYYLSLVIACVLLIISVLMVLIIQVSILGKKEGWDPYYAGAIITSCFPIFAFLL